MDRGDPRAKPDPVSPVQHLSPVQGFGSGRLTLELETALCGCREQCGDFESSQKKRTPDVEASEW